MRRTDEPEAVVVDRVSGHEESAGYLDSHGSGLFVYSYVPIEAPRAAVVICSPLEAEMARTYRRDVLLARSLASAGLAVQRFHYRGCGNSDGDVFDSSFQTMCDDAATATRAILDRTGVESVAFVGTRWGALVAASVRERFGPGPLALWEPVVNGSSYFRTILRARLIQDLAHGNVRGTTESLVQEIGDKGFVDIVGYPIWRLIHETGSGMSLADGVSQPRPILLVQIDAQSAARREYVRLAEHWRSLGCQVDLRIEVEEQSWWFGNVDWRPEEQRPAIRSLIASTAAWLVDRLRNTGAHR